jgi:hypothetical protein
MANSAEIIENLAIQTTLQKILLTIREGNGDLKEIEQYIVTLLKETENKKTN